MKKLTKKKVIIISAVAVVLAVAIPISVKNIRSYVAYVDSFGSDTIEEAAMRTIENQSYKEELTGTYPRKVIEELYGKKWWENSRYLEIERGRATMITKYGKRREYRCLGISSKTKLDTEYFEDSLDFEDIYDVGLEVEEAYYITIIYESRRRYDFDVKLERYDGAWYSPVGEWSEWCGHCIPTYTAYKVDGKWYCLYWGE